MNQKNRNFAIFETPNRLGYLPWPCLRTCCASQFHSKMTQNAPKMLNFASKLTFSMVLSYFGTQTFEPKKSKFCDFWDPKSPRVPPLLQLKSLERLLFYIKKYFFKHKMKKKILNKFQRGIGAEFCSEFDGINQIRQEIFKNLLLPFLTSPNLNLPHQTYLCSSNSKGWYAQLKLLIFSLRQRMTLSARFARADCL